VSLTSILYRERDDKRETALLVNDVTETRHQLNGHRECHTARLEIPSAALVLRSTYHLMGLTALA
jgi:hypothetical protein